MSRSSLCLAADFGWDLADFGWDLADFGWDLADFGLDLADFGRGDSRASTDLHTCVLITSTSTEVININLLEQHGITNRITITGIIVISGVKSLISK